MRRSNEKYRMRIYTVLGINVPLQLASSPTVYKAQTSPTV